MDGALMNLMLDGVEAMRGTGGELIVTRKKAEHGRLMISVTDTGVLGPVTDAERIFEVKPQGTGLGLCISRRMNASQAGSFADGRQQRTGDELSVRLAGEDPGRRIRPPRTRPQMNHREQNSTMRWSVPID
jgi:C4-dicarboxylate-specific signal transduction histidine kinase